MPTTASDRMAIYVTDLHRAKQIAALLESRCTPPKGGLIIGSVTLTVALGGEIAELLSRLAAGYQTKEKD